MADFIDPVVGVADPLLGDGHPILQRVGAVDHLVVPLDALRQGADFVVDHVDLALYFLIAQFALLLDLGDGGEVARDDPDQRDAAGDQCDDDRVAHSRTTSASGQRFFMTSASS